MLCIRVKASLLERLTSQFSGGALRVDARETVLPSVATAC